MQPSIGRLVFAVVLMAAPLWSCELPIEGTGAKGTWVKKRVEASENPFNYSPVSATCRVRGSPSSTDASFSNAYGFDGDSAYPEDQPWSANLSVSWEIPPDRVPANSGFNVVFFWNASKTGTVPSWGTAVGSVTVPNDSEWGAGGDHYAVITTNLESANQSYREKAYFYGEPKDHNSPELVVSFNVYAGSSTDLARGSFGGTHRRFVYQYEP